MTHDEPIASSALYQIQQVFPSPAIRKEKRYNRMYHMYHIIFLLFTSFLLSYLLQPVSKSDDQEEERKFLVDDHRWRSKRASSIIILCGFSFLQFRRLVFRFSCSCSYLGNSLSIIYHLSSSL